MRKNDRIIMEMEPVPQYKKKSIMLLEKTISSN